MKIFISLYNQHSVIGCKSGASIECEAATYLQALYIISAFIAGFDRTIGFTNPINFDVVQLLESLKGSKKGCLVSKSSPEGFAVSLIKE